MKNPLSTSSQQDIISDQDNNPHQDTPADQKRKLLDTISGVVARFVPAGVRQVCMIGAIALSIPNDASAQNLIARMYVGANPATTIVEVRFDNNAPMDPSGVTNLYINSSPHPDALSIVSGGQIVGVRYTIPNTPNTTNVELNTRARNINAGYNINFAIQVSTDAAGRRIYGENGFGIVLPGSGLYHTMDLNTGVAEVTNENVATSSQISPGVFSGTLTNVADSNGVANSGGFPSFTPGQPFQGPFVDQGYYSSKSTELRQIECTDGSAYPVIHSLIPGTTSWTCTIPGGKTTKWIRNNKAMIKIAEILSTGTLALTSPLEGRNTPSGFVLSIKATPDNLHSIIFEKSTDGGRTFVPISTQTPLPGSGEMTYTHTDPQSKKDDLYRIREQKLDGSMRYTNIVRNNSNTGPSSLSVYPIPAHDHITIDPGIHGISTYGIINLQGQKMMSGGAVSRATSLDISKLSAGMYLLYASDHDGNPIPPTKFQKL